MPQVNFGLGIARGTASNAVDIGKAPHKKREDRQKDSSRFCSPPPREHTDIRSVFCDNRKDSNAAVLVWIFQIMRIKAFESVTKRPERICLRRGAAFTIPFFSARCHS